MDPRTVKQIAQWVDGTLHGASTATVTKIVTDSRSIGPGEFFVALQGDRFDGHHFLPAVQRIGASGALVSKYDPKVAELPQVEVQDTLAGLQQLADRYRNELRLKAVCVTGSNGKTSTKEMIAAVAGVRYPVAKTVGNLNNHIGLPLTILDANSADAVGVFEIGMNHAGEVAPLAAIARPDIAVITNIGVAHIGFLGSREAIAAEKATLAEAVPETGWVILNAVDDFTDWIAGRCSGQIIRAGIDRGDLFACEIEHGDSGESFTLVYGSDRVRTHLPVLGEHMVMNAALATAAGVALGLTLEECASGLAKTVIPGNRLKLQKLGEVVVINDAYNANPDSMVAALRTAAAIPVKGRRAAALGRMGELGEQSKAGHERVGHAVAELGFNFLLTVGEEAEAIAEAAAAAGLKSAIPVKTHAHAVDLLIDYLRPGDLLLVKGSLTAAMDQVVQGLWAAVEGRGRSI
jgi:UDP-N-acetylmuramoyl-tripeptide--D-alanyl-D-alanine ligase